MKATEKRILEVLGPAGLGLVIRRALAPPEMVRIANACRVSVPGMRNRAVPTERLSEALADKFVVEGPARRAILKALAAASRPLQTTYRSLGPEELRLRLSDGERVRADAELGKLLFLLLTDPREGIGADEIRAAVTEATPPPLRTGEEGAPHAADDELVALRREKTELSRRAADLVALVDRLRERDRRFREEIAQRKFDVNNLKLQLSQAKKEREALERESRALAARLDQLERKPPSAADLSEKISAALTETRRLAVAVDKLPSRLPAPREEKAAAAATAQQARAIDDLRREIQAQRKELGAERDRLVKMIEATSTQVGELSRLIGAQESGRPVGRREGPERLGVFVDVQNMFYAARGQNARLDFDILLQTAARGRRLVRAVAYVVESKDVDQSGFIALLQQKRYEVKRKALKVRSDGSFKGDWDMEIALDALEMADSLDVVVLVTGDGDFTTLVQKLKIRGPKVEVYSFPRNTAKELREAADRFVPIDRRMLIKMPTAAPPLSAGAPAPRTGNTTGS